MIELEKPMYSKAKPETIQAARLLRNHMTFSEKLLWKKLKGKQINGVRFRRQHPIDFFIADFYCHQARLVVEIDGEIHTNQEEYDKARSAEMERYGIKVIRYTNQDIQSNISEVVNEIRKIVTDRISSPPWGI